MAKTSTSHFGSLAKGKGRRTSKAAAVFFSPKRHGPMTAATADNLLRLEQLLQAQLLEQVERLGTESVGEVLCSTMT